MPLEKIVEKRQSTPLRIRDFSRQFRAMFLFRCADRFGSVSRSVNYVATSAILITMIWLMGFLETPIETPVLDPRAVMVDVNDHFVSNMNLHEEQVKSLDLKDTAMTIQNPEKAAAPGYVMVQALGPGNGVVMSKLLLPVGAWPWFLGACLLIIFGQADKIRGSNFVQQFWKEMYRSIFSLRRS